MYVEKKRTESERRNRVRWSFKNHLVHRALRRQTFSRQRKFAHFWMHPLRHWTAAAAAQCVCVQSLERATSVKVLMQKISSLLNIVAAWIALWKRTHVCEQNAKMNDLIPWLATLRSGELFFTVSQHQRDEKRRIWECSVNNSPESDGIRASCSKAIRKEPHVEMRFSFFSSWKYMQ
jgi:hypothetical protein